MVTRAYRQFDGYGVGVEGGRIRAGCVAYRGRWRGPDRTVSTRKGKATDGVRIRWTKVSSNVGTGTSLWVRACWSLLRYGASGAWQGTRLKSARPGECRGTRCLALKLSSPAWWWMGTCHRRAVTGSVGKLSKLNVQEIVGDAESYGEYVNCCEHGMLHGWSHP